ncbi:MAG: hypothetical protein CMN85_11025 [Spongiibacteraceae bacterium]|nr:hypothetical protein [Spongiibacteraceae bacterium]
MNVTVPPRHKAVIDLDVAAYRQALIEKGYASARNTSDEILEISMHQVRVELTVIPYELRRQSRNWLMSRGHTRWRGLPWPPAGLLP